MRYWFKESLKLFFTAEKKEIISFFLGVIILFIGCYLKAPQLENVYTIGILTMLTMVCRYNFVADYIISLDIKNLITNKNIIAYIVSKNILSFLITFFTMSTIFLLQFVITNKLFSINYYLRLTILGICVISLNNIIFIFHNKPSKLRSNNYSVKQNIKLGFKDLIESLPSLIIVFGIYYFNRYFYTISFYQCVLVLVFSIILLKIKLVSLLND